MSSAPVVGVIPILDFSSAAGGNGVLEVSELPEVNAFAFVVNRSQPPLVFCDPVDATDPRCIVALALCVSGVLSLRHRPQVFDPVVVPDSIDVVDEIWVGTMHEFPDDTVRNPDRAVCADTDVPLRVAATCGFTRKDFVPRGVAGAQVPEQSPRGGVMLKNFYQFGLGWQNVGVHSGAPCDMGTSIIDQMGNVKEPVCH